MADVASTLRAWSTTTSSNSPSGTTTIGSGLAPNLQQIQATIRQYLASKGSDIASAATVNLAAADGFFVDITGTTTITSFGTESAGISYLLRFTGALTLTHNGTSLIIPGAANITTANGDFCQVTSLGSGNWVVDWFSPSETSPVGKIPTTKGDILAATAARTLARVGVGADGTVLTANSSAAAGVSWASVTSGPTLGTEQATTSGTSIDFTGLPSTISKLSINFVGVSTNGSSQILVQVGPSGGAENTGYTSNAYASGAGSTQSTAGFIVSQDISSGSALHGRVGLELENSSGFTWVATGQLHNTSSNTITTSAGSKSAAAAVTRVRITTVGGTDTFDAGKINIQYQ